jgi:hypothetical protein
MATFDTQHILSFLGDKWRGRPCQMCGVGKWNVQESTFQLTEFNQGSMVIGGPVIPVVPVTCDNCGNTVLVNAILTGIVPREPRIP